MRYISEELATAFRDMLETLDDQRSRHAFTFEGEVIAGDQTFRIALDTQEKHCIAVPDESDSNKCGRAAYE